MSASHGLPRAVGWRACLALVLAWLLLGAPGWLGLPHPYSLQHATLHSQNSHPRRICLDTADGQQFSSLAPVAIISPAAPRFAELSAVADTWLTFDREFSQYNRPPPLA